MHSAQLLSSAVIEFHSIKNGKKRWHKDCEGPIFSQQCGAPRSKHFLGDIQLPSKPSSQIMLIYLTQEIFIATSPISNLPFFTHTAGSALRVDLTGGSDVAQVLPAVTGKRQTLG